MHDPSKVLLGSTEQSWKVSKSYKGTIEPGVVCSRNSTGVLIVGPGNDMGVSLGKNMGGADYSTRCEAGLGVPVALTAGFTPTQGGVVHINDTTGLANAAGAGNTETLGAYSSGVLTGIKYDANGAEVEVRVALVKMVGGL